LNAQSIYSNQDKKQNNRAIDQKDHRKEIMMKKLFAEVESFLEVYYKSFSK